MEIFPRTTHSIMLFFRTDIEIRKALRGMIKEINLIKIAGNYGWPDIRGVDKKYNITPPIAIPASGITWAPAGLAYYNGYLFFGGLRGKALYQAKISPN